MNLADLLSERKVLSGATHSEPFCIEVISQLEADDFTDQLHRALFELIADTYKKGTFPSYGILLKEAQGTGLLASLGRLEEIKYALTDWGYTDNIQYWIDELTGASKAQAFNSVLRRYQATLADHGKKDIDTNLAGIINDIFQIDLGRTKDEFEDGAAISAQLEELIAQKIARFNEASLSGNTVLEGLSTGFKKLDELTLGYKPGDLIVLGAQTGHGKTAFALQTAKTIAVDQGNPVLYINTEMSKETVYQRLCGVISGVPYYRIRQGSLAPDEQAKVSRAIETIKTSPFIHSYSPHLTPVRCVVLGKKAKIQKQVEMIIVDYIGRMEKYDPKMQEWQVLEQVAKSMKLLAQELKIPVLVLAQLNEDGSLQGAKRIKNECDLLLKLGPLSKEEIDKKYSGRYTDANYKLYIDKNRDGEPDKNIALHYDKPVQQIRSATPKDDPWLKVGNYVEREVS